jgi:hypothetical protein
MFKGLGNLGNLGNIMKQVQEVQERIAKLKEELANRTVEGSAGGGMITVVANGNQEIKSIHIDPASVDIHDLEMLQDLIVAATNQAIEKSREMMAEEMSKLTGGIKIPGLTM